MSKLVFEINGDGIRYFTLTFAPIFGPANVLLYEHAEAAFGPGGPNITELLVEIPWSAAAWDGLLAAFQGFNQDNGLSFTFLDGEGAISDGVFFFESMEDSDVPQNALFKAILWEHPEDSDILRQVAQVWEDKIRFHVFLGNHTNPFMWDEMCWDTFSWKQRKFGEMVGMMHRGDLLQIGHYEAS